MLDVIFARFACRAFFRTVAGETVGATVGVADGVKVGPAVGVDSGANVTEGSN